MNGDRAKEPPRTTKKVGWGEVLLGLAYAFGIGFTLLAAGAAIGRLANHEWAEAFDPAKEAAVGLFGIGALAATWFSRGWLGVREKMSYEAYALGRAYKDLETEQATVVRLTKKVAEARGRGDEAAAANLEKSVSEAKERAARARMKLRDATEALHNKFPEDAELTEDFHAVFPETLNAGKPPQDRTESGEGQHHGKANA